MTSTAWTDEDIAWLRAFYEKHAGRPLPLQQAEDRLGRLRSNICRKARALGLTMQSRPRALQPRLPRVKMTKRERSNARRRVLVVHGHPRGALGMKHTPETKRRIAEASRAAWADPDSGHNTEERRQHASDTMRDRMREGLKGTPYSRCRGGKRADLGDRYFRSAWEANYARYLVLMVSIGKVESWEYEPRVFEFSTIKRGTRSYTPDFLVMYPNGAREWHEVKGWMDAKSKTRLRRMAKHYPDEKVVVIGESWFRQARRGGLADVVPGWERGTQHNAK